ncbi:putative inorganic phosphate cotransporter [Aricia agestis]|uniref:putative inorganic phosphate cotransporter n=1 Tax=Aricia agestis TaxID=91739 RepID=UPI001C20605C|nr:putative inorganic phosphate cotransporter [Aricia agestis]
MVETDYKLVPSKDNGNCEKKPEEPATYGYGVRHVQALLFFFSLAICYSTRAHLGVSIVAMTMDRNNDAEETRLNESLVNQTIPDLNISQVVNSSSDSAWQIYRTYDWPKSTQEMVLGAFFLGYCIMMFPFGMICQRFGGKIPLQVALLVNFATSFLTPWFVAWGGWKTLCACRVIQGLSQAGCYPALSTLLSNWVPLRERGSLSSYVYTGSGVGTIVGFQMAGLLASSRFGWPSSFWVVGVLCLIGFILLTVWGSATPDQHRSISEAEKAYIMGDIGQRVVTKSRTPWRSIITSVPVWSTFVCHVGSALCFVFFFTQVPTYMYAILKFNIRNSGLLSSLPYISAFFTCVLCGFLTDYTINRNIVSIKTARIASTIIACCPAACLALVSYTTNTVLAVACFVISMSTHTAMHTGWVVNYMDLSPNFSATLMASGNTLANILVVLLPVLVSQVVTDVNDVIQWRIMFFLISGLTLVTTMVFVCFMSPDVQPWNDDAGEKDAEDVKVEKQNEKLKS